MNDLKRIWMGVTGGLLCFTGMTLAQTPARISVSGTVAGVADSTRVCLWNVDNEAYPASDRHRNVKLAEGFFLGGTFRLEGELVSPALCRLEIGVGPKRTAKGIGYDEAVVRLLLEGGEDVTVEVPSLDSLVLLYGNRPLAGVNPKVRLTGTGIVQQQYESYLQAVAEAEKAHWAAAKAHSDFFMSFQWGGKEDSLAMLATCEEMALQELDRQSDRFMRKHPDFLISAYIGWKESMTRFRYTESELDEMLALLAQNPDTARYARIRQNVEQNRKYARGVKFADFPVLMADSTRQQVHTLLKPDCYTIVDFWASWCGPCRRAIPHLKELRKTYNGRLEIISLSLDEKWDAWQKAMAEEQMMWPQAIATQQAWKTATERYGVNTIPFIMVLNPQGEVECATNSPQEVSHFLLNELKN